MKKFSLLAVALIFLLAACTRDKFVKKLVGTWTVQKYQFAGGDKTTYFDTTFRDYSLQIREDENYVESWKTYSYRLDSVINVDSVLVDTANMIYNYTFDTVRTLNTVITPGLTTGKWDLLNSEEDLQLRNDSARSDVRIFRILELTKNSMNLKKGNEEFNFNKR